VSGKSSYLQYLPPVLWENEPEEPEFSLGTVLRVFEKVLTGIADDVAIQREGRVIPPVKDRIDKLHRLFDPWTTDENFLPWLASWVALEFPTLRGEFLWDAYQRRKVTSEIARIHGVRGLKAGLNAQLDLYAVGSIRPRVAVDDGSRVLVTAPSPTELAPVASLVTCGPVLGDQGQVVVQGLIRPSCVAVGSGGSVFLGDVGVPAGAELTLPSQVWRITSNGDYDLAGTPPKPQPLPFTLDQEVAAVAVRPALAGQPETLYVLERNGKLFALPAPYVGASATQVAVLATAGASLWPVAMCVDRNRDLLVLDRGMLPPNIPAAPKIITVTPGGPPPTRTPLHTVVEPLSILVEPEDGSLIIGDGGEQDPTAPAQFAGTLVRVDRIAPANWTETVLLPPPDPQGDPPVANPLVAPTALVRIDERRFYVLDVGLKPVAPSSGDPFVMAVAEPAAVYRVELGQVPSAVRVTEAGHLVFPTGMTADGERLIICDPGQPDVLNMETFSRVRRFRFDVVIHFADSRLPPDPDLRSIARKKAVGDILAIVEQHKPAHTVWSLVTQT